MMTGTIEVNNRRCWCSGRSGGSSGCAAARHIMQMQMLVIVGTSQLVDELMKHHNGGGGGFVFVAVVVQHDFLRRVGNRQGPRRLILPQMMLLHDLYEHHRFMDSITTTLFRRSRR